MKRVHEPSPGEPLPDAPLLGAVLSPTGTVLPVPHALTSGRPKPEPAERWTLGPEQSDWPGDGPAPDGDTPMPPVRRGRRAP